jgi:hypothetical protein
MVSSGHATIRAAILMQLGVGLRRGFEVVRLARVLVALCDAHLAPCTVVNPR